MKSKQIPKLVSKPKAPSPQDPREHDHHSAADWDFGTTTYELSTTRYVSPLTSLLPLTGPGEILCRISTTLNLPQGQIRSHFYPRTVYTPSGFFFRNQAPLGQANHANTYEIRMTPGSGWSLYKWVDGAQEYLGGGPAAIFLDRWTQVRVTWWDGLDPSGNVSLVVFLEVDEPTGWDSRGLVYDTSPAFGDSSINRVGLQLRNENNWADNTQIWGIT